jgi:release factor glutamine methyltransferase
MSNPRTDEETVVFGGVPIRFDPRVLRPRDWTIAQSRWAATLLDQLPAGRVLELCTGAGQIGLAAVAPTTRHLLAVDADPVAAEFARANAETAGLTHRVEVRAAPMTEALRPGEEFVLVIADPPWVREDDTGRYPADPLLAIDGGPDGLDVARTCLLLIGAHLAPQGLALLQLGTVRQAAALEPELERAGLQTVEVRTFADGVVAQLGRLAESPAR